MTSDAPKEFQADPGVLARWYSEARADDPTMATPAGRRAAAKGLADTYGVSEYVASRYIYYYFPNTTGRHASRPRSPSRGSGIARKGSFDYQCSACHKVFAGPDYGYNPGHDIQTGPSGAKVSHGYCDKTCIRNHMVAEARRNPTPRETRAAAITARDQYRKSRLGRRTE